MASKAAEKAKAKAKERAQAKAQEKATIPITAVPHLMNRKLLEWMDHFDAALREVHAEVTALRKLLED